MNTALLPIYGRAGVVAHAIIDADDMTLVEGHRWHLDKDGYVWCHLRKDGKDTTAKLHRIIMSAPVGMDVDHISGNGLDNRRCNLRVCTHAQNMMNMPGRKARSGYRGVRQFKNRWHARIQINKRETHLGAFATAEEAWAARRAAEFQYKGEFAPAVNP